MDLFKYFDVYSLRARVFPALIAGLPSFALLAVIVPWDHLGVSQVTALAMSIVLLFAFADVARRRGKVVQDKLGIGSTPRQWYRGDSHIPEGSKNRFRSYIANKLGQTPPSQSEEQTSPEIANDFYLSANAWLRDRTRDTTKYSLLFSENITYGFRRNLLGLKYMAIVFNLMVLFFSCWVYFYDPNYFSNLPQVHEKLVMVTAAALLHSLYMVFAVNCESVRQASYTYGRQLILSCEQVMSECDKMNKEL